MFLTTFQPIKVKQEVIRGIDDEGLLDEEGYFDVVKAQVLHGSKYPHPIDREEFQFTTLSPRTRLLEKSTYNVVNA